MTLAYHCSNCGELLETTNADPLNDQMDTLVKALEPFAKIADHFDHYEIDPGQPEKHSVLCSASLLDLRRAREVLALLARVGGAPK